MNGRLHAFGRRTLPRPVRSLVRTVDGARRDSITWATDRLAYLWYRARLAKFTKRATETIDYSAVRNSLANSGPPAVARRYGSARDVLTTFRRGYGRIQRSHLEGFEGLALDDALFDPEAEAWHLRRCARLAGLIANFAFERYAQPSILDLGCGPALLFCVLRRYGIRNYIGVDGNPLFRDLNRHLAPYQRHFQIFNLAEEIALCVDGRPLTFDIICSFEVLEHITENRIDNLIRTIRRHMHPGSTAFLTASLRPATDVDVHVLVRDRQWWLERFACVGLRPHPEAGTLCARLAASHPWNWHPSDTNIFVLHRESKQGADAGCKEC